jgi:hypothetical protein
MVLSAPMKFGSRLRPLAILAVCLATLGCDSARWDYRVKAPGYHPPERIALYVLTTEQVNKQDTYGVVLTLIETLERDLHELGIGTELVVASDDPPPVPRVELRFAHSDAGSALLRGTIGYGAGAARVVVDCSVHLAANADPSFIGRIRGVMSGGIDTGDPRKAAVYAAEAIADAVASSD